MEFRYAFVLTPYLDLASKFASDTVHCIRMLYGFKTSLSPSKRARCAPGTRNKFIVYLLWCHSSLRDFTFLVRSNLENCRPSRMKCISTIGSADNSSFSLAERSMLYSVFLTFCPLKVQPCAICAITLLNALQWMSTVLRYFAFI